MMELIATRRAFRLLLLLSSGIMILPVVDATDDLASQSKDYKRQSMVSSKRTADGIRRLVSKNGNIFTMVKPSKNRALTKMTMRHLETNKRPPSKTSKTPGNQLSMFDHREATVDMVYALCDMYQVFDNSGRGRDNDRSIPGFEWHKNCDNFQPLQSFLCPIETIVQEGICMHKRPHLNPAVRQFYCSPLTSFIKDEEFRSLCETWCTNFVSMDRGNCCQLSCATRTTIATTSSGSNDSS